MAADDKDQKRQKLLDQLRRKVKRGETVFREGEAGRELYILLDGAVEIRRGETIIATIDQKDTYLGEMSMLLGAPRSATVVATADSSLLCVPQEKVVDFFNYSPALALKLARILAARLQEMNKRQAQLMESAAEPQAGAVAAYERLVATPARRKLMAACAQRQGTAVPLRDLARELGVSAAEAGRILDEYAQAGLVRTEDESAYFLEPEDQDMKRQVALFAATDAPQQD